MALADSENLRRWRLILGGDEADGTDCQLQGLDAQMDASLSALYEFERKQRFEYIEKDNSKVGCSLDRGEYRLMRAVPVSTT